jgi:hypothetical protein
MKRKELWAAVYQPSDTSRTSRFDFPSKEAAKEYVFSQMCQSCSESRELALKIQKEHRATLDEDMMAEELPGCFWEWLIMKTKDYQNADSMDDLMEAAGWEKVYKRPKSETV